MIDYSKSKIYMIQPMCVFNDGDIYIGSSTHKNLNQVFYSHISGYYMYKENRIKSKTSSYLLFDKYGVHNCDIVLIENVNCNSADELKAIRKQHILNTKCINIKSYGKK